MNESTSASTIVVVAVALDAAAFQTLENFIANGGLGSTPEEALRAIVCNKLGQDIATADPDNLPPGEPQEHVPTEDGGNGTSEDAGEGEGGEGGGPDPGEGEGEGEGGETQEE